MRGYFRLEGEGMVEASFSDDDDLRRLGVNPIDPRLAGLDRAKAFSAALAGAGWCHACNYPPPAGNDYTGFEAPALALLGDCVAKAMALGARPTTKLNFTAPETGSMDVPQDAVADAFAGAPDWGLILAPLAERNARINDCLAALRADPSARDVRVFGSLSGGKAAPGDVDVAFDTRDRGLATRILRLAAKNRGILDPFDLSEGRVACLWEFGNQWVTAKRARAFRKEWSTAIPVGEVEDLDTDPVTIYERATGRLPVAAAPRTW